TIGNKYVASVIDGKVPHGLYKDDYLAMEALCEWYQEQTRSTTMGFFQLGGGISGDYPICCVPLLKADLKREKTKFWSYFAQVSDADVTYGGYSGATPREKITWFKLDKDCPTFEVHADFTIAFPIIASYVLAELGV